jgi:tetratricopeptide (TPR) repeat protein
MSGLARAEKDARTLFQEANAHFAVGEFNEAGEKYQQAYKQKQDPALLYNAAQAFRLGGNNEKALVLYKNYVMFYPRERNVDDVKNQIAKLKEAIAAQEQAKTAPPINTVEPRTGRTVATAPTTTPSTTEPTTEPNASTTEASATPPSAAEPAATATTTTKPPDKKPIYKQWWLWTVVGVVVAGGVVTAAVVATTPSREWNTAPPFGPGAQSLVSW